MKTYLISVLLVIGLACSCGNKEPVAEIETTEHVGKVVGLSTDLNEKKHFEMIDQHGLHVSAQYFTTTLAVGDSIKYTTPATDDRKDLGLIVHYGQSN